MNDAYILERVRRVVDPMFMKLRSDLFGSAYNNTLAGHLLPRSTVETIIEEKYPDLGNGGGGSSTDMTIELIAGTSIARGKFVYYEENTGRALLASSIVRNHAGKIIGVATESAEANMPIKVQISGMFTSSGWGEIVRNGPIFISFAGEPGSFPPHGSAFRQKLGQALTNQLIIVDIEQEYIIL